MEYLLYTTASLMGMLVQVPGQLPAAALGKAVDDGSVVGAL